jgi:hypothetical protein
VRTEHLIQRAEAVQSRAGRNDRGIRSAIVGKRLVCSAHRVPAVLRRTPAAKCLWSADVRDCPVALVSEGARVPQFELRHPFASIRTQCPRLAAVVRRESRTDTQ